MLELLDYCVQGAHSRPPKRLPSGAKNSSITIGKYLDGEVQIVGIGVSDLFVPHLDEFFMKFTLG
ncbi:MAG: hypothetical protein HYX42_09490 [Polaromonas sp.]|uniref:hypothetical protein n=1 Tax=Polaromonas sp. TaxID=1869339 RepID=UPI0025DA080C|nr:hypothetical protein [Polaromonas sp.]MBI2726469.1 hypothetical protein [Polaromonas sp.]